MSEETSSHASAWERWTGDRGPFYRACAVVPFDAASDRGDDAPPLAVSAGLTRLLLRNLPTLLLAVLVVYVPLTMLGSGTTLTGPIPGGRAATFGAAAAAVAGWLYLLYKVTVGAFTESGFHRTVLFFVTAAPLAAVTGYAVVAAGPNTEPGFVVQAGFFLFVLLAGHLTYDGLVLRAEHLFTDLRGSEIVDETAYESFYEDSVGTLGDTFSVGPVTAPRSVWFAGIVSGIPLALPLVVLDWNIWVSVAFVPYSVLSLLVVALVYDVAALVYQFTRLLQSDALVYRPFHPDEHGGFRDLGRFATRVNLVLLVTGCYVAFRFYTEGIYFYATGGFASTLGLLTWAVSYLLPVVAYGCFVAFWLYHSFWRLHRKMEEGRRKRLEELQRAERERQEPSSREFTDPTVDAAPWESLRGAPRWPIKRQSLFGVLLLDAVPVAVTFLL